MTVFSTLGEIKIFRATQDIAAKLAVLCDCTFNGHLKVEVTFSEDQVNVGQNFA